MEKIFMILFALGWLAYMIFGHTIILTFTSLFYVIFYVGQFIRNRKRKKYES